MQIRSSRLTSPAPSLYYPFQPESPLYSSMGGHSPEKGVQGCAVHKTAFHTSPPIHKTPSWGTNPFTRPSFERKKWHFPSKAKFFRKYDNFQLQKLKFNPGGGYSNKVRIHLKILYSNFLFIHHETEVGMWFYIVKTAIQAEIGVAKCLKCGAFCSAIQ